MYICWVHVVHMYIHNLMFLISLPLSYWCKYFHFTRPCVYIFIHEFFKNPAYATTLLKRPFGVSPKDGRLRGVLLHRPIIGLTNRPRIYATVLLLFSKLLFGCRHIVPYKYYVFGPTFYQCPKNFIFCGKYYCFFHSLVFCTRKCNSGVQAYNLFHKKCLKWKQYRF